MTAFGRDDGSTDRVADAIGDRLRRLDGEHDLDRRITDEVRRSRPLASEGERHRLVAAVRSRLGGLDRLDPLLADPSVDEVLVGHGTVWVDREGRVEPVDRIDDHTVRRIVERVIAPLGRRLDRTSPIVDARLPDGSRVCAVIEPVSVEGPTLSIRRFAHRPRPLSEFVEEGPTGRRALDRCTDLVTRRCNVVVSGATSSGKTSLLAALLELVPPGERVVVLEDIAELPCTSPRTVRLEAVPGSVDGPPPIPVEHLVRTALRLRPDRLVVGEVRGDEVLALVQAMNTGHDGSFSTCHANGPADALLRLESLVVRAAPTWPLSAVRHTIARSVDAVVHVERRGGRRVIADVAEVCGPSAVTSDEPLTVRSLRTGAPLARGRR